MTDNSNTSEAALTPGQTEALRLVEQGNSICLTGAAGSGKSYIIKRIMELLGTTKKIAVTALTGIAGTHIDGMTLHSWAGIPTRQTNKELILKKVLEDATAVERWKDTDLLVIDEVSMMSAELFNKLDFIGRNLRATPQSSIPFGGIQLILSGDFCQLPPIGHNDRYCFESSIWPQTIQKTIYLQRIMRQSDPDLQAVLNEVRLGQITQVGKELLNSRLIKNLPTEEARRIGFTAVESSEVESQQATTASGSEVRPTLVYPHKVRVAEINKRELDRVLAQGGPNFSYSFRDEIKVKPFYAGRITLRAKDRKDLEAHLDKHCNAERELLLAVGCQVMLLVNLDLSKGLVNGATGVVTDFEGGFPKVRFYNGLEQTIGTFNWKPDHPKYLLQRTQVPLMLSWAITVHRAQGATLPCVVADLREAFSSGMAYVILSRIKSLSGLYLEGISYSKIKCDPRVRRFYRTLMVEQQ